MFPIHTHLGSNVVAFGVNMGFELKNVILLSRKLGFFISGLGWMQSLELWCGRSVGPNGFKLQSFSTQFSTCTGNRTVSSFPLICHFLPPLIPCFYHQAEGEGGDQEQLWSWVMKEFPTRWW